MIKVFSRAIEGRRGFTQAIFSVFHEKPVFYGAMAPERAWVKPRGPSMAREKTNGAGLNIFIFEATEWLFWDKVQEMYGLPSLVHVRARTEKLEKRALFLVGGLPACGGEKNAIR